MIDINKEKVFFITGIVLVTIAVSFYLAISDRPTEKPVISLYTNETDSIKSKETNIATEYIEHKAEADVSINYPIDINFASKEELCSLNGIGDELSNRIIEYRNDGNFFYSIEDITVISGIGNNFLEMNKDKIKVDTTKLPKKEVTTVPFETELPKETTETTIITETSTPSETKASSISVTEITSIETTVTTKSSTYKEIQKINLNEATYEELMNLPISSEIAENILETRDKIEYFSSKTELYIVEGVTIEIYNKISPYVYV